jgi:heme-degrading monooxygenase HmoA
MAIYTYVWEFVVLPEQIEPFLRAYGPAGEWVRLFRRAPGYVRTELHRDGSDPCRFITIDYWESADHWQAFRSQFAQQFETLDAKGERLTQRETELGHFELVE